MLGKVFSSLVVALVLCCPLICGSASLLHHHGDSVPSDNTPHTPHDSCTFDECFCNGPSVPTHGPAVDLSTSPLAVWASPCDGADELAPCPGYLSRLCRPPRSVAADHSLPLLI
ncbi:MAG: hypothetical protein CHACPFDD_02299 [Phycisphaerae bacterium]|nr:hypothetical protein [Phycisphaerae bacterium]